MSMSCCMPQDGQNPLTQGSRAFRPHWPTRSSDLAGSARHCQRIRAACKAGCRPLGNPEPPGASRCPNQREPISQFSDLAGDRDLHGTDILSESGTSKAIRFPAVCRDAPVTSQGRQREFWPESQNVRHSAPDIT